MSSNNSVSGKEKGPSLKSSELLLSISKIGHDRSSTRVSALYTKKAKRDKAE